MEPILDVPRDGNGCAGGLVVVKGERWMMADRNRTGTVEEGLMNREDN